MPSPFPGMDPYLESPRWFPDLHNTLIVFLKVALQPRLPQPYYAQSSQRVWLEVSQRYVEPDVNVMRSSRESRGETAGVAVAEPEVEVEVAEAVVVTIEDVVHDDHIEPFIEIRGRWGEEDRLVATIEVLSPANKTPGDQGYDKYRSKQREFLDGQAHLIEIDLLRGGTHVTAVPRDLAVAKAGPFDYHVSVRRSDLRDTYFVYPIRLEERLPGIAIPLLPGDPAVPLDLQAAFVRAYDAGPFQRAVRYGEHAVVPPLRPEQAEWAGAMLAAAPSIR